MKKRLLSLGLALVMLLSLLPTSVFAASYQVGDEVVLHLDDTLPTDIPEETEWDYRGYRTCDNWKHYVFGGHTDTCRGRVYVLVSTSGGDSGEGGGSETPSTDPGKVTAHKTATKTADEDDYYTITLTIQGNKVSSTTAKPADVVLVMDTSGSMGKPGPGEGRNGYNDCMDEAKTAAKAFSDALLGEGAAVSGNQLAVVSFNKSAATECGLTSDKTTVDSAIDGLAAEHGKGTYYGNAFDAAYNILHAASRDKTRPAYVVFISDGAPSDRANDDYTGGPGGGKKDGYKTKATNLKKIAELYTIGINLDSDAQTTLSELATDSNHYKNVSKPTSNTDPTIGAQLVTFMTDIAYKINEVAAGTNAVMTDVINPDCFELVDGSISDSGLRKDSVTGDLVWDIGEIPSETKTVTFKVKLKDDVKLTEDHLGEEGLYTNSSVDLTYTDAAGNPASQNKAQIGDPQVDVPANAAVVTVKYVDESGNSIDTDLTATVKFGTVVNANSTLDNTAVKKTITGYTYEESDPAVGITVAKDADNVLTLKYQQATYNYTVNYYKDDIADANKTGTVTGSGTYGSTINVDAANHVPEGYTANCTVDGSTTLTQDNQVVSVIYSTKRSDLSYTIYYKDMDGNAIGNPTSTTVGNQTYGAEIDVTKLTHPDIDGYSYNSTEPADKITIGTSSNVITMHYEKTYTLTYDANGGTGAPAAVTGNKDGATVTLSTSGPTAPTDADGKKIVFVGWSETQYGILAAGDTAPTLITSWTFNKADKTVYSVWSYDVLGGTDGDDTPDVYQAKVTFKVVGGQWSDNTAAAKEVVYNKNETTLGSKTIPSATADDSHLGNGVWTKDGSTDAITDMAGQTVKHGDSYTCTFAQAYTLTYDANGGSGVPTDNNKYAGTETVTLNNTTVPTHAQDNGKNVVFVGWSAKKQNKIYSKGEAAQLPTLLSSVTFANANITVYAVWSYDEIGNDPEKTPNDPDGKGDVLQAEVTYKIENGYWDTAKSDSDDKVYVLDLTLSGGVYKAALGSTVPTGMTAAAGYTGGNWDTTPTSSTVITKDETYTYTFGDRYYTLTYDANGGNADSVPTDSTQYAGTETVTLNNTTVPTHAPVGGKNVVFIGWSADRHDKIYSKGEAAQLPTLLSSVTFNNANITVYAVWSYDEIGNDPEKTPNDPDGKGDVLQAEVTYKIENGYWDTAKSDSDDKVYVLDLTLSDGVYKAALGSTVPTSGMTAADGYTGGSWNATISAATAVTGDATYTYTFSEIAPLKVDPQDPNGDGNKTDALVWKKLSVSGTGFKGETFTVTLYPVRESGGDGQGPDPRMLRAQSQEESYTGTVTMTAAGTQSFSFTKDNYLTFTEPGHYWFKVVETKGSTRNMTYDETEYQLYLYVSEQDGKLCVTESKAVTVENSYKGSTGVVVPADKVVQLEKGDHFNYVMGYSDGTIRPNNQITRAEVAIIFFRLLTKESRDYYYSESNDFTDVAATSKSNIAISTLTKAGILTGYSDGTFRPNAKVTRGQLAAIIARFADMKGDVDKTFTDIDGYWAKDLILLAASNGWIDGYGDGTFRPANNITRAQTMAIINRALDRQVSHVEDLLDEEVMNVWVDNMDPDAWYYFHVQEATNYHSYVRKGVNSLDEKWTAKIEDIDWAVYQF